MKSDIILPQDRSISPQHLPTGTLSVKKPTTTTTTTTTEATSTTTPAK
jgi:hypothetical protein